ncbi:MAG: hypothetical protein EON59_01080 [Alphaproteobacteria bacterium]|nr:MAG: hypothetical protein EON59_01080 [Alphaproteobacteria bacterium]
MSAKKTGSAAAATWQDAKPAKRGFAKPRSARAPAVASKPGASRVARTAQAIAKQVSDNPFVTLAGAAAVTAGIALLLPASRREAEAMGDLAGKIGDAAREAADGAVEAGRQQVTELAQAALSSVGGNLVESLIGGASPKAAGASRKA